MAIAKMKKLNLAAMSYDKDAVLNALQRTNASEVKFHYEAENTAPMSCDFEELAEYLHSVEASLSCLSSVVDNYNKERKIKDDGLSDGFEVGYFDFMSAKNYRARADEVCASINGLYDKGKEISAELAKIKRSIKGAEVYCTLEKPFSAFSDTQYTRVKIGTVPANLKEGLLSASEGCELTEVCSLAENAEEAVILSVCHKSALQETEALLQSFGFKSSIYAGEERSGKQIYDEHINSESALLKALESNTNELYSLKENIKGLKIYCDYLGFELEKASLSEKMRVTQDTFLLEAYVPEEAQNTVAEALNKVSGALYYEFSEPAEDEVPPTLYRNNAVVRNFEAITNMYSPANSKEFDPNAVMAVFYSIFLGFIMGDIGYGLIMLLGGGAIYLKTRAKESGLTRLAGVFAIGGICTIVWGFLFNSLFGQSVLPFTVMPPLRNEGSMWSLMGIGVPAVLIISMLVGIVQLCAGYVCKAVQYWRRGHILDGIFEGMTWALFCVGVFLALMGLTKEFNIGILATVGGIIAAVALVSAMLTAGRHEKFFGKFTKGFGAAYGVINFASDILSYARLYGLLLSGAVIAEIVSSYGIQFITGGNFALAILGVIIMVVGHAFNLAMGLLGAYIHDARLQYVEFYGRFFEGEGELFTPLGSKHKYINLSLK